MPLTSQTPVLARGFDILFDQELAPVTTPDSARVWAKAYTTYVVSAGIPTATAKEAPLAAALATAFNPEPPAAAQLYLSRPSQSSGSDWLSPTC